MFGDKAVFYSFFPQWWKIIYSSSLEVSQGEKTLNQLTFGKLYLVVLKTYVALVFCEIRNVKKLKNIKIYLKYKYKHIF
jgi:hypothetical protein